MATPEKFWANFDEPIQRETVCVDAMNVTTATSIDFGKYLPADLLANLAHPALRLAWLAEMYPEIVRSHFHEQLSIQGNSYPEGLT